MIYYLHFNLRGHSAIAARRRNRCPECGLTRLVTPAEVSLKSDQGSTPWLVQHSKTRFVWNLSTFNNSYPDFYTVESHAKYEIPEMSEALSLSSCVILHLARLGQPHTDVLNLLYRELSDTNLYPDLSWIILQNYYDKQLQSMMGRKNLEPIPWDPYLWEFVLHNWVTRDLGETFATR